MRLAMSEPKLDRHRAFLERTPMERPLIGSWLYGFYVPELYPRLAATLPVGLIQPDDISVDLYLEDIDALLDAYRQLDDDYSFAAGALPSVPWLEAIMGCPIHYSGTTMWADPCLPDWSSYSWRQPTLDDPWARKLVEMLDALVKHSGGRFGCTPTLMRGPADMAAAMRGSSNLALDLFDHPAQLERLAEMCADVWIELGQAQLALIPDSENGYMVGCAGLRCWMPEKGIWLQDDAVSVLSPRYYRQIFLPHIRRVAGTFPQVAFHLHGNQLWPIDMMLDLDEIDVLELNYDLGATGLEDKIIPAWRRIQGRKPCIAFAHIGPDELGRVRDLLSPAGLSFQVVAPTLADGRNLRDLIYRSALER